MYIFHRDVYFVEGFEKSKYLMDLAIKSGNVILRILKTVYLSIQ